MKELHGNTFPHKELIKSNGGKWDASNKYWMVPEDKYEMLNAKVDADTIKLSGQLWEECECCGQEPIYLNVGVCERCAYKGYRR